MPNPVGVRRLRLDIRLADTDSAMRLVFGAIIEALDVDVSGPFGFLTIEASSPDESQASVVVYPIAEEVKEGGQPTATELLDHREANA